MNPLLIPYCELMQFDAYRNLPHAIHFCRPLSMPESLL